MNTKTFLAALTLAGTAIVSVPASASTIPLAPAGPGMFAGSFEMAANGLIIDDFSFSPASFEGLVSVTLSSLSGPVSFFTASFFPDTSSEIDFSNFSSGSFSFGANVTDTMPLTLRVFGAVLDAEGNLGGVGAYNVLVTEGVAAVPEPQTYLLLLAGLGVVALGRGNRKLLDART